MLIITEINDIYFWPWPAGKKYVENRDYSLSMFKVVPNCRHTPIDINQAYFEKMFFLKNRK